MSIQEVVDMPTIGHNSGATDLSELIETTLKKADEIERGAKDYLESENADLMRRLREINTLIAAGLPTKCSSKVEAEKLSDVRFAIKKWISAAKQARTAAKRPWDSIAKAFYAVFARPIDDLEEIDAKRIEPILADWQEREAARVKREAEEAARLQREEADRKAKEAAEAEARRLAAEQAEREANERAAKAERDRLAAIEAAAQAKRQREEDERKAAEARERARIEEAERKARAEREAIEKAERARIEAEEKAKRDAERKAEEEAAKLRRDELKRQEAEHKEAARIAAEERREAERAAVEARKEQRTEKRNETEAIDAAIRADKKADKNEDIAGTRPAELSRVRGEAGSVSSLRTFWTFRDIDRSQIDLEALRQHIPLDALATAVRSFIDAGGRSIRGAHIYEDQQTTTR